MRTVLTPAAAFIVFAGVALADAPMVVSQPSDVENSLDLSPAPVIEYEAVSTSTTHVNPYAADRSATSSALASGVLQAKADVLPDHALSGGDGQSV